jgi:uncharacterized protein
LSAVSGTRTTDHEHDLFRGLHTYVLTLTGSRRLVKAFDFSNGETVHFTAMKKPILQWLILLPLLLLCGQAAWGAEEFPKPTGLVNDFAGVIPPGDREKMAKLATEVLQKTGTAVVVVTMPTIGDSDAAIYANELFEAWGIGKKGEDKGVLIFLALTERRIQIETGYGVEGILPDGLVGEILDKTVVPFLQKDQYGKGLSNALSAVSAVIAKDANVELTGEISVYQPPRRRVSRIGFFPLLFLIIIIFSLFRRGRGGFLLPLLLLSSMGGRGGYGGGFGGFGGGFGGFGGGLSGGGGAGRGF